MKEFWTVILEMISKWPKQLLALMAMLSPVITFVFFTYYAKYKMDQATIGTMQVQIVALTNAVNSLVLAEKLEEYILDSTIQASEYRSTVAIETAKKQIIKEVSDQMEFLAKYQHQNINLLIDHFKTWQLQYSTKSHLPDSLTIKYTKIKKP